MRQTEQQQKILIPLPPTLHINFMFSFLSSAFFRLRMMLNMRWKYEKEEEKLLLMKNYIRKERAWELSNTRELLAERHTRISFLPKLLYGTEKTTEDFHPTPTHTLNRISGS